MEGAIVNNLKLCKKMYVCFLCLSNSSKQLQTQPLFDWGLRFSSKMFLMKFFLIIFTLILMLCPK